jgi:hypothetical protein
MPFMVCLFFDGSMKFTRFDVQRRILGQNGSAKKVKPYLPFDAFFL